jgi:hypothetical protein
VIHPPSTEGGKKGVSEMYSQEDAPPCGNVRLLVDLEYRFENQIRAPWLLLEEPRGKLVANEGALGAVDRDLYGLARDRGDGVALVEGYRFL